MNVNIIPPVLCMAFIAMPVCGRAQHDVAGSYSMRRSCGHSLLKLNQSGWAILSSTGYSGDVKQIGTWSRRSDTVFVSYRTHYEPEIQTASAVQRIDTFRILPGGMLKQISARPILHIYYARVPADTENPAQD